MLSPEIQNQLTEAGVPSKHWPALEKGKPYIPTGTRTIIRVDGGKVKRDTYDSSVKLSNALSLLRLQGVPMTKVALGILNAYGKHLSPQEKARALRAAK